MTDIELLKLAAKAAGYRIDFSQTKGDYFSIFGTPYFWNPALNTKQAFELADRLHMMIDMTESRVSATYGALHQRVQIVYGENDRMAVNRMAIVMLAADVGRHM